LLILLKDGNTERVPPPKNKKKKKKKGPNGPGITNPYHDLSFFLFFFRPKKIFFFNFLFF
jgi:hypothetical protein